MRVRRLPGSERHGDQVAAGVRSAKDLGQKYGVGEEIGRYADGGGEQQGETVPTSFGPGSVASAAELMGKKKPAPPPPRKNANLASPAKSSPGPRGGSPPPVPMSTKPQF